MFHSPKRTRSRTSKSILRRPKFERMEDRLVYAIGDLDLSFGTAGVVRTSIVENRPTSEDVTKVLPRGDGGFYVAGRIDDGRGSIAAVWSFAGDGSLTTSFGSGGRALVPMASGWEFLSDVAVQPDGKLVLAGYVRDSRLQGFSTPTFSRLNLNGTVDPTFGEKGISVAPFPFHAAPSAIAVRPTGEIVALIRTNSTYDLIELEPSGNLIEGFHATGQPDLSFDQSPDDLLLQPDGSVVIALPRFVNDSDINVAVVKHSTTGALDTAFATNGILDLSVGFSTEGNTYDSPLRLKQAANGAVLLAGTERAGDKFNLFVTQIKSTGVVDTNFGANGRSRLALQGDLGTALHDLEVKSDGSLVITGTRNFFGINSLDSVIAWYLTSGGNLDTTINAQGLAVLGVSAFGSFGDSALIGTRVIYGTVTPEVTPLPNNIELLAIKANGQLDTSFDLDGIKLVNADSTMAATKTLDMLELPDHSLLTLVHSNVFDSSDQRPLALVHYTSSGVLDTSFGTNGKQLLRNYSGWIGNLIPRFVSTSFGIFVVEQELGQLNIGKLNGANLLDTSFGTNGWLQLDVSSTFQNVSEVLLTSSSITLAGQKPPQLENGQLVQRLAVVRMDWSGQADATFGSQGIVEFPLRDFVESFGIRLGQQSNGDLLVLRDNDPAESLFAISLNRLNNRGQIDSSFGDGGRLLTGFNSGASLDSRRQLVVLPDDSFLVMGAMGNGFNVIIGIEKRQANGAFVDEFGQGGVAQVPDSSFGQEVYDMDVDSQGRIVVSSAVVDQFSTAVQVTRFLSNGQLDSDFALSGAAVYPLGPFGESLPTVIVDNRDDILVAGGEITLTATQSLVARIIGNGPNPTLWFNEWTAEDVNGDRLVTSLDALLIINRLNSQLSADLPNAKDADEFFDVNNDGFLTSIDALLVINRLNSQITSEGEANTVAITNTENYANQAAPLDWPDVWEFEV